VFACRPSKAPATRNGVKDATADAGEIREQFSSAGPHALVGIACGKQPDGTNLIVVDMDTRPESGIDGRDSFQWLASGKKKPETWDVLTPSGGAHAYYLIEDDRIASKIGNSVSKLGAGIDIRAEGGYVIAAGSTLPDGRRWEFDGESPIRKPAQAPEWLVDSIQTSNGSNGVTSVLDGKPNSQADKLREGQGRNDYLARVAGRLAQAGLGHLQLDAMLRAENLRVCDPPVSDSELRRTVMKSAAGWIASRPGEAAEQSPEDLRWLEYFSADQWASEVRAPEWVTPQFLEAATLSIILGGWGSGKTLIVIDYLLRLASGMPWQGQFQKPRLCVLVESEGQRGVQRRLAAWCQHHKVELPDKLIIIPQAVMLGADGAEVMLEQTLDKIERERGENIAVVVLDTYARCFGLESENNNSNVSQIVNISQRHIMCGRRALIFLHHPGHGDKGRARGGSALVGAADTEYLVSRAGNYAALAATKNKDGEPGQRFFWRFFAVTLTAIDGQRLSVVTCEEASADDFAPGDADGEAERGRGNVQKLLTDAYSAITTAPRQEVVSERLIERVLATSDKPRRTIVRALAGMVSAGIFEATLGDEDKPLLTRRLCWKSDPRAKGFEYFQ
jgi:hypothetical protein